MTEVRALEIIAALGADSTRWPADERAALLALVARPAVAAALKDAATLDALLGDWAKAKVAVLPLDAAALVPAARVAIGPASHRRWWAAGALAAAVAAAVVLTPMPDAPQSAQNSPSSPVSSATGTSEAGDDAAFAYVFTPTVDEDSLI